MGPEPSTPRSYSKIEYMGSEPCDEAARITRSVLYFTRAEGLSDYQRLGLVQGVHDFMEQ